MLRLLLSLCIILPSLNIFPVFKKVDMGAYPGMPTTSIDDKIDYVRAQLNLRLSDRPNTLGIFDLNLPRRIAVMPPLAGGAAATGSAEAVLALKWIPLRVIHATFSMHSVLASTSSPGVSNIEVVLTGISASGFLYENRILLGAPPHLEPFLNAEINTLGELLRIIFLNAVDNTPATNQKRRRILMPIMGFSNLNEVPCLLTSATALRENSASASEEPILRIAPETIALLTHLINEIEEAYVAQFRRARQHTARSGEGFLAGFPVAPSAFAREETEGNAAPSIPAAGAEEDTPPPLDDDVPTEPVVATLPRPSLMTRFSLNARRNLGRASATAFRVGAIALEGIRRCFGDCARRYHPHSE